MKLRLSITAGMIAATGVLIIAGTLRNPNFWRTPDQQGDRLERARRFTEAAKVYADPRRIGVAHYRAGDFASAQKAFARDPSEDGLFNQGNAWLMQGKYDRAIASYDAALARRPGWQLAIDNRALATARRNKLSPQGDEDSGDTQPPDDVVFDADAKRGKPIELSGGEPLSDEALQATWLRSVQTTPGDFLRAKFSYQAAEQAP
jgi:Ca-activated chloride channel family protein